MMPKTSYKELKRQLQKHRDMDLSIVLFPPGPSVLRLTVNNFERPRSIAKICASVNKFKVSTCIARRRRVFVTGPPLDQEHRILYEKPCCDRINEL
jgi:hypothetical protein